MGIAPALGLHRLYIENPRNIAIAERRSACLYNLVSKVCVVAFLAITAVGVALSIGLLPPISTPLFTAFFLTAILLQFGFQRGMTRSIAAAANANIAEKKMQHLQEAQSWSIDQIKTFFVEHRLSLDTLPLPLLAKVHPEAPLKALAPAIANYRYYLEQIRASFKECIENFQAQVSDPIFQLNGRRKAWEILERQMLPAALHAAFCLQLISQPTLQLELQDIGAYRAKEFDERIFDQLLDTDDTYFLFKDEKRPPLTLQDCGIAAQKLSIAANESNIDALRIKLFS